MHETSSLTLCNAKYKWNYPKFSYRTVLTVKVERYSVSCNLNREILKTETVGCFFVERLIEASLETA